MGFYMDLHKLKGLTMEQLHEAHEKDEAIEKELGVNFVSTGSTRRRATSSDSSRRTA
jgi:hypothetical protein